MTLLASAVLALGCFVFEEPPAAAASKPLDISTALDAISAKHKLTGLVAVAVQNGEPVAWGATGVRSSASQEKLEVRDPFHLGSCGKAMTSTLAAVLIEDGQLDWGTTIGDALPDLQDEIHPAYHDVTIEQLLRHRGGIAERVNEAIGGMISEFYELEGTTREQRREVLRRVLKGKPVRRPGSSTDYSNYGYMTAAAMMEDLTDRSWEELIVEELLEPLEMASAGVGSPPGKNHPVGHRRKDEEDDGPWDAFEPGPKGQLPDCMGPAGLLHANLFDWARFVAEHLAGERGEDGLISAESYQRLHDNSDHSGYACGWGIAERSWAQGTALTHNGSDGTWFSVVWASPKTDLIVMAVSNCASGPAALDEACTEILRALKLV